MQDFLYRGELRSPYARFFHAHLTDLANHAVRTHDCDPIAAHVFARAIGAAILAVPMLPEHERFNLRWQYGGALKNLVVDVGHRADLRALIAPANLSDFVRQPEEVCGEEGSLTVLQTRDGRILNSGTTATHMQDVVEDLAFFFCTSFQTESALVVLVAFRPDPERPVRLCQGFMVQALPGCDISRYEALRQSLGQEGFRQLLAMPPEVDNHSERLIRQLLGDGADFKLEDGPTPHWYCPCSEERVRAMLKTLTEADLQEHVDKGEPLAVVCHFCQKRYQFDPRVLLEERRQAPPEE